MSGSFGGKDPFFTRSFKSFGSGNYGSASSRSTAAHDHPSPALVIQELDSDSMQTLRDKDCNNGGDRYRENSWANRNPLIEHPDDNHTNHQVGSKNGKKIKFFENDDSSKVGSSQRRTTTSGVSFQRVTYGGINGPYYTASTTRRAGDDGVLIHEESQQTDHRTGQATHRISKGIHDKGHSVTRKLYSDGKVDMIHKLHNLYKDELDSFEETWRRNSGSLPPSSGYFGGLNSSGSTSDLLFGRNFGGQVDQQLGYEMQSRSATRGRSKKTIFNIPIE